MNNIIQLSNLSKTFDNFKKIKVLKKISYKFKKGKIYSIIGPSGSGKSTLLNLLSLIDKPNTGSIKIENKLVNFNDSVNNDILRANKIGIIYQQDNLLSDFTAIENVYLASLAAGKKKHFSLSKAKSLLGNVGLLNRSDHYPSELSGGEKQRILFVRNLAVAPSLLLLDEFTSNLDGVSIEALEDVVSNHKKSGGAAIIVTHNILQAKRLADKILFLHKGKLVSENSGAAKSLVSGKWSG